MFDRIDSIQHDLEGTSTAEEVKRPGRLQYPPADFLSSLPPPITHWKEVEVEVEVKLQVKLKTGPVVFLRAALRPRAQPE